MSRLRGLGLRPRLALAMAAVAWVSVGLATVVVGRGVEGRLEDLARDRLRASAAHTARLAADLYRRDNGWTRTATAELNHVAEAGQFRLELRGRNGRPVPGSAERRTTVDRARSIVEVNGARVGAVVVSPKRGLLLAPERELQARLDRLHLVSGLLALALGVIVAAVLSASLLRPLRRLIVDARRIEHGELSERPRGGGGREIDQLAQALGRLAQTLQRQEGFRRDRVADVAHELRTPVSGILARIEAAQDEVLEDEQQNLAAMHGEARRLAGLIADLERLADAQRPGLVLRREPVDIAALAVERADAFAGRFAAAGVQLERDLEPAHVDADPSRLGQVLDNLLSNALRFTEPTGSVRLAVTRRGSEAVLEVADTGEGIEAEALQHVFERFWRSDPSRSRDTGGAGIGLAIVRELVLAHGGRVDVESTPGEGSTFRVVLPTAGAGAANAHAPKGAEAR